MCLLFALLFAPGFAGAQWVTQEVPLQAGWNAVYLEVEPDPAECVTVFKDLAAIENVCMWNQHDVSPQFFQDQDGSVTVQTSDFLNWTPRSDQQSVHSLQRLLGGRAYLIKASAPVDWSVKGRPVVPRMEWQPKLHNLAGFSVSHTPALQPRFSDFFANAQGIDGTQRAGDDRFAVVLTTSGDAPQCLSITGQLNSRKIEAGKSYFIEAQDVSSFHGPLNVSPPGSAGVVFGADRNFASAYIRNLGVAAATVTVRHRLSETAPAHAAPMVDRVPLMYFGQAPGSNTLMWTPFPAAAGSGTTGFSVDKLLEPGEEWELRLALDRTQMTAPDPATATWQSLLEITDDRGVEIRVGVAAEYGVPDQHHALWPAGLWVGVAHLTDVCHIRKDGTATEPLPMPRPFDLRLIVHVDTEGNWELLQRAILAWEQGAGPDDDAHARIYVDESRVPEGAQTIRISSIGLGFMPPVAFDSGGAFLSTGTCGWAVSYDDPVNPFVHPFHPDHDNLDARRDARLADWNTITNPDPGPNPVGISANAHESFSIGHQVTLAWTDGPQEGAASALWNPAETTRGTVTYVLTHVRKTPITMRGTFTLKRTSRVGVLTR